MTFSRASLKSRMSQKYVGLDKVAGEAVRASLVGHLEDQIPSVHGANPPVR